MSRDSFIGPDGERRCRWSGAAPALLDYHDNEWGYPVAEDIALFEKICLESFQSGLSWRSILAKRENLRAAFGGFDFRKIARFDEEDRLRFLGDRGIVRHCGKIEAVRLRLPFNRRSVHKLIPACVTGDRMISGEASPPPVGAVRFQSLFVLSRAPS